MHSNDIFPYPDHIRRHTDTFFFMCLQSIQQIHPRLPIRLSCRLRWLVQKKDIRSNEKIAKHADWADTFCKKYDGITEENVMDILKKEVGEVFVHVLEDAGVYKCTEEGREAFLRFVKTL